MQISAKELMDMLQLDFPVYPGICKRIPIRNPREGASYTIVIDWRDKSQIVIEIKPGLVNRELTKEEMKKVPVMLQAPTRIVARVASNEDEDKNEESKSA